MKASGTSEGVADPVTAPPVRSADPADRGRRSSSRGGLLDALREYWYYRELFFFFVWRDVKVRYKQTVLGASWAVLQPFMAMIVFTLLFGRVARLPTDGIPAPLFYYTALLPWTYFATSFNKAGNSLVMSQNLITKIYFPRVLIPASSVLTGLFDLAIALILLWGMMLFYGAPFTWKLLLWPLLIAPLVLLAIGTGLLLSALNVNYRDVKHIIPFMVQLGMFISPVVYPVSMIPEKYRLLVLLNPVAGVIEACRATIVVDKPIDWNAFGISVGMTLLILIVGFLYFRRTERTFADVI